MKVLQLHTRYRQRGGEDVVIDGEAEMLREAGHQVRQVFAQNPDRTLPSFGALALSPWNPAWVRRVKGHVADFKPDVAHIHNTWFAMSPAVIRALNRVDIPVVMTLHNYRLTCANALLFRDGAICEECVETGPWKAIRYACYRDSQSQSAVAAATLALHQQVGTWEYGVNTFIALTEFQRGLMTRAGLPVDNVTVKPNSVKDPGPRASSPAHSNIVIFVGRLSYEKGVDMLLEAWKLAAPDGLELQIVGDGPMRRALEAGAPWGVSFFGHLDAADVTERMLQARAAVLPSRWYEGLPMVMLECLAAGMPVLAGGHGPLRQLISDGPGPSWVVPDHSVEAWAEALQGLTDGERCDQGGQRARSRYEAYFTPEANVHQLESIYSGVTAEQAGYTDAG